MTLKEIDQKIEQKRRMIQIAIKRKAEILATSTSHNQKENAVRYSQLGPINPIRATVKK